LHPSGQNSGVFLSVCLSCHVTRGLVGRNMKLRVRTDGSGADACVLEAEKRRDWDGFGMGLVLVGYHGRDLWS
jgi:hypothetical protein